MREDCDKLLGALIPFAERRLKACGEFYPFGGTMSKDGEVTFVAATEGGETPQSDALIKLLVDGMRNQVADLRAICVVSDCLVVPPGQTAKTDAIRASVGHIDGESVEVFFPYAVERGLFGRIKGVAIQPAFAQPKALTVFTSA